MQLEERISVRVMNEIARVFKRDINQLTKDTRFVEDLHAKSLNIVELIAVLENEFEVNIPFAEARRRQTIGEAIELIIKLRKG